jgi:repressor LexA
MPSYREMAKALGVSAVGTIQDHIKALIEEGYLSKGERGVMLAEERQSPYIGVPIVGEVAAGTLTDAFEVSMGTLPLPRTEAGVSAKTNPDHFFALRVSGESMRDAGIFPHDFVIVNRKSPVKNGDIVVASVNAEATVKEIKFLKNGGCELIPHNSRFEVIKVAPQNDAFRLLGKVVSIQRYL